MSYSIFRGKFFLVFFIPAGAWAAGGGIPVSFIFFQALNFIFFIAIIAFLLRKKAPSILQQKHQDYLTMKKRAENLYNRACAERTALEKKLSDIKQKESQFEEDLTESVKEVQKNLISETKEQCLSILRTAQNLVDQKWMKMKTQLEEEFLNEVESLCRQYCRQAPPAPVHLLEIKKPPHQREAL